MIGSIEPEICTNAQFYIWLKYPVSMMLSLDFLSWKQAQWKADTRTASNYRMHSCHTNITKFTILYQGPRIWNCLPASIPNLSRSPTFKNKVLEFLLNSFWVSFCRTPSQLLSRLILWCRGGLPYKPGGFLRSPRLTTCCNMFKICYTIRQINVMMMMMMMTTAAKSKI